MSSGRDRERQKERPSTGTPAPSDAQLTLFLERQWEDQESPQRLEVYALHGPMARRRAKDPLYRKDYKANPPKPEKEKIVELANNILSACKNDCNVIGKPVRYTVLAFDERRGSAAVGQHPLLMEPDQLIANGNGYDEEDTDGFAGDRLLKRADILYRDYQWWQEHSSNAVGGVLEMVMTENARLREDNQELFRKLMESNTKLEEARSQEEDRRITRMKAQFWLDQMKDGATLVKGIFPQLVNKATGKEIMKVTQTTESLVLCNFFNSCSEQQVEAAFGKYDQEGNQIQGGVFTKRQAVILDGVARGTVPVERLGDLIGEGPDAVTMEQIAAAQRIFTQAQLGPIMMAIANVQKQQPQNGAATTTAA